MAGLDPATQKDVQQAGFAPTLIMVQ